MLRLKLIACKVFYREISLLSARSQNIIDVTYLRQGYHNTPELLHKLLQKEIDRIDSGDDMYTFETRTGQDFDAILLGYGLCSNAIAGLSSKRYKMIVPRAHDCITMFLGSKEIYKEYFDKHSGGIYWYTAGWIENTMMPGKERLQLLKNEYTEKYGEDNAEYLMEMEQSWMKEYTQCCFVDWKELPNETSLALTEQSARHLGWDFVCLEGKKTLMQNFIDGDWNQNDFLVINPGESIGQSFDDNVIKVAE